MLGTSNPLKRQVRCIIARSEGIDLYQGMRPVVLSTQTEVLPESLWVVGATHETGLCEMVFGAPHRGGGGAEILFPSGYHQPNGGSVQEPLPLEAFSEMRPLPFGGVVWPPSCLLTLYIRGPWDWLSLSCVEPPLEPVPQPLPCLSCGSYFGHSSNCHKPVQR